MLFLDSVDDDFALDVLQSEFFFSGQVKNLDKPFLRQYRLAVLDNIAIGTDADTDFGIVVNRLIA